MALSKKATKSPPASAGSAKPPVAPRAGAQAPAGAAPRGVFVEKPQANVYTVMLVVSFIALLTGVLCLCGEMSQYDWDFKAAGAKVPPEPPDNAPPAAVAPVVVPPEAAAQPAPVEGAPPVNPAAAQPPAAQPPAAEQPPTTPPM